MNALRREPALGLSLLASAGLMAAFIIVPLLAVVVAPGIEGYQRFFSENASWGRAIQNSLVVTLLGTATSITLGFVYAYAIVYSEMPWKPFFRVIAILPMLSPPFVVAFSYVLLFGPRGLITYGVFGQNPNVLGMYGLWGVQTIAFFPYAYQLIADALSRSDPRLEQAARNLGAGWWQVFRTVTLPLTRPGLLSAILLVFIYILEDFGNAALIGGQFTVLPTLAYGLISGFGDFAGAAAVSSILLAIALALWVLRLRVEGRRSYTTISGRGSSIPRPPVPAAVTWLCFAACLALTGLITMVYGVLVLSALVKSFPFNMTLSLDHFQYVGSHSTSLQNSLIYAGSAAFLCACFAMLLGYLVQRREWTGKRLVSFVALAPAAVPGIFFGIGYAITFNQAWLGWLDRGLLIILSMVFWNVPMGFEVVRAGLQQIDRSIDDAASLLGAGSLRSLYDILLPLLRGAFVTGLVTGFVRAVTTLSVLIFLFTPSTTVATITIFQLVNDFDRGGAAAFAVTVISVAVVVVSVISLLGERMWSGRVAIAPASAGRVSVGGIDNA